MKTSTRRAVVIAAVTTTVLVGGSAAVAVAVPGLLHSIPSAMPNGRVTQIPAPEYQENALGQTYGSAAIAQAPELEPDLISAVATNGKVGYVLKTDLDEANGTTAAESFTSPADALRWQETEGTKDHTIAVYDVDGTTQIGEFVVTGSTSQAAALDVVSEGK
ncbi:hypothetical protein [Cellulomonas oligotrophica]|uniref:Uncharacterized protein n=1 Tax=Cellulomonas oligotrophica TaxID=931536 RepID=A0A7Y9FGY3_9CELL|nr:hypothetical protein [Cellulomonas oligotrophica]NYD87044.1 hypothetical protein [Cellulomonas oligotrophica]GIG32170.1 hypothetical protein Col01nite_13290 [Cellulomonas oligotrophica]